ncbi:MAG TPA: UTP--glucose-1-phosphate uridylyltransferase [Oligoflexia bacterium]|nr:UTP--glucose-1-phosphate uridylyltransferase [Oligoflexia bacterium]HMR25022.1 UTP--glucose-1-phosphate uridylyltransferase [Oligoflexia bacterium]
MSKIKIAVIPAAGLGTRFLPATKQIPKELLPIVNRPAIEYVVDELVESGIETIVFVLHPSKMAILEHFKKNERLEAALQTPDKQDLLHAVTAYQNKVKFDYVFQHEAKGLGHAILCAEEKINEDYFVVALPDDLVLHTTPCLKQLLPCFENYQSSVLALEHVPMDRVHQYGIVSGQEVAPQTFKVEHLVEKPKAEDAPSQESVIGRYILHKNIFNYIKTQPKGALGEIQLTDALLTLAKEQGLYGYSFAGKRLDTGQAHGFIEANIMYALEENSVYKDKVRAILEAIHANL